MRHKIFSALRFSVSIFWFSAALIAMNASAGSRKASLEYRTPLECDRIAHYLDRALVAHLQEEKPVDIHDTLSYMSEMRRVESLGNVITEYDPEFHTRFYYTASGKPDKNTGKLSRVNPDARAIYIFFHGAGTSRASGKNFVGNMNDLDKVGYSAVSFDFPFHADGPRDSRFEDNDFFLKWITRIIKKHSAPGVPVRLFGHSFGANLAPEIAKIDPTLTAGALAASPAAFDPVLEHWYNTVVPHFQFFKTALTDQNKGGEAWESKIFDGLTWFRKPNPDPTLLNPKYEMRFLIGDHEEYVPSPNTGPPDYKILGKNNYDPCETIRKTFKNVKCIIAPGGGHYIFNLADENGNNILLREMLALDGRDIAKWKQYTDEAGDVRASLPKRVQLAQLYAKNTVFKAWADETYGANRIKGIVLHQKDFGAQAVLEEFDKASQKIRTAIDANIVQTKDWAPDFYAQNKELIEKFAKTKASDAQNTLWRNYYAYLEGLSPDVRKAHATLTW